MRQILVAVAFVLGAGVATTASAACYHFDDSPSDVYVCVGKNGSDSSSDRQKAQSICSEKTGKKCGPVGSYSSSCHSNIDKCYDESGKANRELKGY
jgi:hypothetical protein